MVHSGFSGIGNLSFSDQFLKKWHLLASTASGRKCIRYQWKTWLLMIHFTKKGQGQVSFFVVLCTWRILRGRGLGGRFFVVHIEPVSNTRTRWFQAEYCSFMCTSLDSSIRKSLEIKNVYQVIICRILDQCAINLPVKGVWITHNKVQKLWKFEFLYSCQTA